MKFILSLGEFIQLFPKGTSCGRDGLRAQHLLDEMCGEGSTVSKDVIYAIILVVNLWFEGICQMSLEDILSFAQLMSLLNPDGRIRPNDMGSI